MKCMVMAVMLLLGAMLTAQANYIPARKSPTEFYTATAICDKKLVRPLTREQPAYCSHQGFLICDRLALARC
jgi:hypothetical protein